jgi:hypothetical protein
MEVLALPSILKPEVSGIHHGLDLRKEERITCTEFLIAYRNHGQLSDLSFNLDATRCVTDSLRYGEFSDN